MPCHTKQVTLDVTIRPALPKDAFRIRDIVQPYADRRILLAKDLVTYFESIQEFYVAERAGRVIGCGALHVMWEDLAEVRTLAVEPEERGLGIGYQLLDQLLSRARELEIHRVFCLTFEVDFFSACGFTEVKGDVVDASTHQELLLSRDDGVAEFLDLSRVKPNTLGNTRMITYLR